jgi:uncharacterized repeat protein (TIGR01451 family)
LRAKADDPLLAQLNAGRDEITKQAEALAASADPMGQLAAIQAASQKLAVALGPEADAFARPIRDLEDCSRLAGMTIAGLYRLPNLTFTMPPRVVPGDVVPVSLKLEGKSDLKYDASKATFSLATDPTWPVARRGGQWTVSIPPDATMGSRVQVKARATVLVNRQTPIVLENTTTVTVAPRAAGDVQIVDILDEGMTYVAETTLQNNGNKPVQCALQPVAPAGWTVAGPASLSVAAQAEARARFTFKAPAEATMGRYTFMVRTTIPGEQPAERSTAAWFVPPQANKVVNPGFENNDGKVAAGWGKYEKGYTINTGAHTGKACIRCDNADGEGAFGALQSVTLNQKTATPIVIRGFSKCENVPGTADPGYSIYADIYYTDGKALYGQTLEFAPGTHDWQFLERTIEPAKPIATVNLYLFIRGRRGTVYFDDLLVAEDQSQQGDVALAATGTQVATDSDYTDYTPAPLTDGITDTTGLDWNQAAWASADNDREHWIELTFPKPTSVSRVSIYWNAENNVTYTSRDYQVQAWVNGAWQTVASVQDQPVMAVSTHSFAPVTTEKLRVLQAPKGGYADRPGIIWVSEVKVF